jgi:plastocyanin
MDQTTVMDRNLAGKKSLGSRAAFLTLAMAVAVAVGMFAPAMALAAPAVVVKMTDKPPMYKPLKVTVKVGQTVEWINNAETLHSVTTDADSAQKPTDVSLPPGAKPFDSGFMKPGAIFDYKFTVPGTYKYLCLPHEKDGMIGTVVVSK